MSKGQRSICRDYNSLADVCAVCVFFVVFSTLCISICAVLAIGRSRQIWWNLWEIIKFVVTRNSAIADKPRGAFRGQSRSSNVVPFHMLGMVSYYCALSVRLTVFEIFDFKNDMTLKTVKGSVKVIWNVKFDRAHASSYWHSIVNVSIQCRFWGIRCQKMSWPWNPG